MLCGKASRGFNLLTRTSCESISTRISSSERMPPYAARSRSSAAAAAVTSRSTSAMWAAGCWTPPVPVRSSPALRPTSIWPRTRAVYGDAGAIFIVKNYTGGVLNTEIALELAQSEGFEVASVLVNDDVAVERSTNRRGMGAAVLVEKIAGAAAEAGQSLAQVTNVAERASNQARSMGVALSSCTSPTVGRPTFELPPDQMELGVGIHGEHGRHRAPLGKADAIVELLVENDLGRPGDPPRRTGVGDGQRSGRNAASRTVHRLSPSAPGLDRRRDQGDASVSSATMSPVWTWPGAW